MSEHRPTFLAVQAACLRCFGMLAIGLGCFSASAQEERVTKDRPPATGEQDPAQEALRSVFDHPLLDLVEDLRESVALGLTEQVTPVTGDAQASGTAFHSPALKTLDVSDVEARMKDCGPSERRMWAMLRGFKELLFGHKSAATLQQFLHADFTSSYGERAMLADLLASLGDMPIEFMFGGSTATRKDDKVQIGPVLAQSLLGRQEVELDLVEEDGGEWKIIRITVVGGSEAQDSTGPGTRFSEIYDPRGAYEPIFTPQY